MGYRSSEAFRKITQLMPPEDLQILEDKLVSVPLGNKVSEFNRLIEEYFGYLPHIFTLSDVKVVPNNGREEKEINGMVSMSNSCMWISIRDFLRVNGYPEISALRLKIDSGLNPIRDIIHPNNPNINNVNGMWYYEYQEHIDSLESISRKYNLTINVYYHKRDKQKNILLSNRPLVFGNGRMFVNIISYGAHFELVTYFRDIFTGTEYQIEAITKPEELKLSASNNGITTKPTGDFFIYEHTEAFSDSLQEEMNRLTKILEKSINTLSAKMNECGEGGSTLTFLDDNIEQVRSKIVGIRSLKCDFIREKAKNPNRPNIDKNIEELEAIYQENKVELENLEFQKKNLQLQVSACRVEIEILLTEGEDAKLKIKNLESNKKELLSLTERVFFLKREIEAQKKNLININRLNLTQEEKRKFITMTTSQLTELEREEKQIREKVEKILNRR